MASGPSAPVLALCVVLSLCASAWGDDDCKAFRDVSYTYRSPQKCYYGTFCCGSCSNRYCCGYRPLQLTEDEQDDCSSSPYFQSSLPMILGIAFSILAVLIFICCCVCPCCCLYKMCRKPRPMVTTTAHTTVITATPQQYPQQPVAPVQTPGYQYPPYNATPVQPGYGTHPMVQSYGTQPTPTAVPYQGQPYTVGPPPTYQEATGPTYPPNPMPYSQAAFTPGQTPYPLQPPGQMQPNAAPSNTDYQAQPAYNPDYISPHP